jgi:hypothetical protein
MLRYAEKRERMGQTGHDFVLDHCLLTRPLREYLTMIVLCLDDPETSLLVSSQREGMLQDQSSSSMMLQPNS